MILAAGLFAFTSCDDDDAQNMGFTAEATLFPGETMSLTASASGNFSWTSSNDAVVTVDAQGKLVAIAPGTATITAKDGDREEKYSVDVKNGFVFDGERKEIVDGAYGDYTNGEPEDYGFQFWFYTNNEEDGAFKEAAEYIWIDIPNELMGETFELTEEKLYDWGWWIQYAEKASEIQYQGLGGVADMQDVETGTMRGVALGDGRFRVEFDIRLTDGKKLQGGFYGQLDEDASYYGGARRGRQTFF